MARTLVEKILLAHCDADDITPGDVVTVRCDVVMANDVSGPVAFRAMEKMGAERVFDPSRVVMVADHFMPAKDVKSAELQARLKRWSEEQGVTYYGQGRGGIEHTLLCEEGWIVPGAVIAGGDSHTCTYGALGAFGTGLGSTDIASCLALGSFWQAVPETIQIELSGRPGSFVTGKDVILAVLARIGVGGGTNAVLEFVGPGAEVLSVDERLAVANMAVEAGSETGIFPADGAVSAYLEGRARTSWTAERSDPDATFRQRLEIDLSALEPLVALPHLPGNVKPVSEVGTGRRRPGLHRQLRERDDDRPPAGGVDPRRPERSSADARDRRPGDAGDLASGRGRGPARPVRRGGRDRLHPDLRRLLRRLERHPRAG